MKNYKNGFAPVFILILIVLVVIGAVYFISKKQSTTSSNNLSLDQLRNAKYNNFQFVNGQLLVQGVGTSGQPDTGKDGKPALMLNKLDESKIAYGDLNNDGQSDAAAIVFFRYQNLTDEYNQYRLHAIINNNGIVQPITRGVNLEFDAQSPRVKVQSISISDEIITLNLLTKPTIDSPFNQNKTLKYKVVKDNLVFVK